VTDFGIARITDSSKTKTGLVLGTPSYMSPEQIAGKKVDGRSDLYSLGVMLYQMLTGVLPFRGDSMAELMYRIANEEAPDIRVLRADMPERLANVVALAVTKRPEDRYQSGEQFAADLRSVLTEVPEAPPAAPRDFERTTIQQAPPGYDAAARSAGGEGDRFDKTNISGRPPVAAAPAAWQIPDDGKAQTGKI